MTRHIDLIACTLRENVWMLQESHLNRGRPRTNSHVLDGRRIYPRLNGSSGRYRRHSLRISTRDYIVCCITLSDRESTEMEDTGLK